MNLQEMCNKELINLSEELLLENRELRKKIDGYEKVRTYIEDKNILSQGGIVKDASSKLMCAENDTLNKQVIEQLQSLLEKYNAELTDCKNLGDAYALTIESKNGDIKRGYKIRCDKEVTFVKYYDDIKDVLEKWDVEDKLKYFGLSQEEARKVVNKLHEKRDYRFINK